MGRRHYFVFVHRNTHGRSFKLGVVVVCRLTVAGAQISAHAELDAVVHAEAADRDVLAQVVRVRVQLVQRRVALLTPLGTVPVGRGVGAEPEGRVVLWRAQIKYKLRVVAINSCELCVKQQSNRQHDLIRDAYVRL